MSETRATKPKFAGYTSPNYTQVPDVLFDEQLPDLSGAELKVLLYIMRRTFGFKKDSDNISLSQITNGITTAAGEILDRGTGLSKDSVTRAVKSLQEQGIIARTRRRSDRKGDEPTTYALNVGPVSDFRTPPGGKIGHPLVEKSDTQETVKQETVKQDSNVRMASPENGEKTTAVEGANPESRPMVGANRRGGATLPSVGDVLAERARGNPAAPSTPGERGRGIPFLVPGPTRAGRARRPRQVVQQDETYQVIQAYIADFAREFNDRASLRSSTMRAYNLFQRAGISRDVMIDQLYAARAITKERAASIRSQAGTDAVGLPVKARMPFFFAVLEDLLGLKPETDLPG